MNIKLLILTFLTFQCTYSQNYKFGKVSKEELLQKVHSIDSSANAAILYREHKTRFEYSMEDGFYMITEVFERIKIYNKKGFKWATKSVKLYRGINNSDESLSGLKGYTYSLGNSNKVEKIKLKSNGVFDEDVGKYLRLKKFTMPDIKEGSVIEYKYKIKSSFISNIDEFRLQERIPLDNALILFRTPEYFVYKIHQKGWLHFDIVKDGRQKKMQYKYIAKSIYTKNTIDETISTEMEFIENSYTINMKDVPAVKEELYSGNLDNYMSSLKFELSYTKFPNSNIENFSKTWEIVSKKIYETPSFGRELDKTKYFKNDIDNLLSGVSDKDEKMNRIFEFVKSKMNWDSYIGLYTDNGVKKAYKEGVGNVADINLMLTAMFRYAGLNANPILISTKSNGIPVFPTRNGFNYIVSGVEISNTVLLFDATNKDCEVNILDPILLNWQGRIIRKEGSSNWVPLIPRKHAVNNSMINVIISEDLIVKGTYQKRLTGHFSQKIREEFKNTTNDFTRKAFEKDKGEIEITNIEFKNLKTLYKPVSLSFEFESFDVVEEISDKLYFSPLLFLAKKENPFKLENRKYPIDYSYPRKNRIVININIPEGYKVESIPENASFSFGQNDGSFRYQISVKNDKIQLSIEFLINKSLISAESYQKLKGFYQLMIEKENEKIVLSKI